ncbi:MAG: dockerin type I domain-containing protein, partial [Clostridiales bacterium]|nr:dockerin type I domain-containing protein [Clostridiales bacterium]
DPGAVFDTPAFGAGNGGVLGSPINVFYALGEDSEIGYLSIAPGNSSATFACPLGEFVTLGEFRFAFRAGKSTADLTEDSIRIMAVEELYALRQTTAVLINTDRGISYRYGAQWNGLAMPQWDSLGKPAIIWELIKGVEISGIVKSYNPLNPIDIKLVQDGSIAYETTVAAAAWAGWDPLEQGFIFEDVIPGIYSLVITKAVHTKITVQTIVVADDDLDLSKDSRSEVQLMTMRCGDISNDGLVNDADLTILWRSGNYNKKVDEAENSLCDLNGDGLINDADLTILWLVYNYNRGEIIVP